MSNSSSASWDVGDYTEDGGPDEEFFEKHERDKLSLGYRSCFLFPAVGEDGWTVRQLVFNLTHHQGFEGLIVVLIVANCVFLAIDDPVTPRDEKPTYLQDLEYFFTACFAVELLLKVQSQGFVLHPGSYLRTGWNRLDFVIVTFSFLSLIPSVGNYTALRTLRVLRPLRSINGIQGLRNIVNGLLHSLRKLLHVLALAAFIFAIFGILGVQLWSGKFKYRCQQPDPSTTCTPSPDAALCCNVQNCCVTLPQASTCLTLPSATAAVCQCRIKDTLGSDPSLIDWSTFCNPTARSYGIFGEFFGHSCHGDQECVDTGVNPNYGYTNFDHIGYAILIVFQCLTLEGWVDIMYIVQDVSSNLGCVYFVMLVILGSYFVLNLALAVINEEFDKIGREEEEAKQRKLARLQKQQEQALLEVIREQQEEALTQTDIATAPDEEGGVRDVIGEMRERVFGDDQPDFVQDSHEGGEEPVLVLRWWRKARWWCWDIVSHRFFTPVIIVFITVNTALLASEHHNQPAKLTYALDKANLALTVIFIVEMMLKLMASGVRGYLKDPFNALDGIVVVLSVIELVLLSNTTVSVFRALRLLRVFKLLKNFPRLRDLVEVILAAVSDTGYLNLIILLYIFCAALVGMQLFGGEFLFDSEDCVATPCPKVKPRATFDSFYWSVLAVFQVLTRDDWVNVMWDAMRATHPVSTLYFLVLVICGDFVILNLFLAILIQSFDQNMRSDDKAEDSADDSDDDPPPPVSERSFEGVHGGSLVLTIPISAQRIAGRHDESFLVTEVTRSGGSVVKCKSELLDRRGKRASLNHGGAVTGNVELRACLSPKMCARQLSIMSGGMSSQRISAFNLQRSSKASHQSSVISSLSTPTTPCAGSLPGAVDGHTAPVRVFKTPSLGFPSDDDSADVVVEPIARNPLTHCEKCNEARYTRGLVVDTNEVHAEVHGRTCPAVCVRKVRQERLAGITKRVEELKVKNMPWSKVVAEQILSTAWEMGIWLHKTVSDLETVDVAVRVRDMTGVGVREEDLVLETFGDEGEGTGLETGDCIVKVDGCHPGDVIRPVSTTLQRGIEENGKVDLVVVRKRTWSGLHVMCLEEGKVLRLELGEGDTLFGGAFMKFVTGRIPRTAATNGGTSLFIFGPENPFRLVLHQVVKNPNFEKFILACIIISSALMIAEDPKGDDSGDWGEVLTVLNYVIAAIFILEMIMKIIAFGLVLGEGTVQDPPYLKDFWNLLDGPVAVFTLLSVALVEYNFSILKVLRTFRVLRPLRVISRNKGLRMVVITLLRSISSIGNVALVTFIVFLVFGILGVQLFGGKFYYCNDPLILHRSACYGYYLKSPYDTTTTTFTRRVWKTDDFGNFDNIIYSVLTLFEVATLELWTTIMYKAMDGVSYEVAPRRDHNIWSALFFIAFVVVGSFFILNLFVGFVIFNFAKVKSEEEGTGVLYTLPEQRLWVETQSMMLNFRPTVRMMRCGNKPWRHQLHAICVSNKFEYFIGAAILLNVVVMSLEHDGMGGDFDFTLWVLSLLFIAIFILEAVAKSVAFGTSYLKDPWNRFDFTLVVLSVVQLLLVIISHGIIPINSYILRVARVFRIMRVVRLVRSAKDVRILLETIWFSLPHIANIGAFLCLLFFIYAVLGVKLFAKVKRDGDNVYLTRHANFESFPTALMLLIRMITGENWNGVMHETMITTPDCETELGNCGEPSAPLYYISFLLLATFILTNLFVAIILDNFRTTILIEKTDLRMADLHTFMERWADFDPDATLRIPTCKLPFLLEQIGTPLGIRRRDSRIDILNRTKSYCIPEHGGVIHFIETLIPLARLVMISGGDLEYTALRDHEEQWRQAFPDINDLPLLRFRQRRVTVDQYFSSTYIAAAYRRATVLRAFNKKLAVHKSRRASWQRGHPSYAVHIVEEKGEHQQEEDQLAMTSLE